MTKINLTTASLALLNSCLIALTVFAWRNGQQRVREPAQLSIPTLPFPDLTASKTTSMPSVDVAAIRDQAVFHNRRSFYQPPPPSEAIPTPDYDFAGSMGLPQGNRVAFVKRKSDQSSRTVHVGDDLDGWRVQLIDTARILVVRDAQHYELKAASTAGTSGLIRGSTNPSIAQSGIRVLTGQVTSNSRVLNTSMPTQARTYRPPPP